MSITQHHRSSTDLQGFHTIISILWTSPVLDSDNLNDNIMAIRKEISSPPPHSLVIYKYYTFQLALQLNGKQISFLREHE